MSQCVYTGKCRCKEKRLRSVSDLCKTKHDYGKKLRKQAVNSNKWNCDLCLKIPSQSWLCWRWTVLSVPPMTVIKAIVLSAHDKGSHAEVQVKVRKVFRSGQVALYLGTTSVYPLSWTSRGCTCPILNPGEIYSKHGKEMKLLIWLIKHCIINQ